MPTPYGKIATEPAPKSKQMSELNEIPPRRNLLSDSVGTKQDQSIKGYTRAVRRKLYFLFAMLALVIIMMNEARKPENWMWMGFKPNVNNAEAIELNGLANVPNLDDQLGNDDAAGSFAGGSASSVNNQEPVSTSQDSIARGGEIFWNRIWNRLETRDQTALVELIQVSQKSLDQRDINLADFDPLMSTLLQARPEDDSYREKWDSTIRPGMIAVSSGEDLTLGQQIAVKELFKILDPLIVDGLDDFTSPGRKSDMPAWHRFWGRILENEQPDSVPVVSPVQLVAQPDVWRFEHVLVRGRLLAGRAKPAGIH